MVSRAALTTQRSVSILLALAPVSRRGDIYGSVPASRCSLSCSPELIQNLPAVVMWRDPLPQPGKGQGPGSRVKRGGTALGLPRNLRAGLGFSPGGGRAEAEAAAAAGAEVGALGGRRGGPSRAPAGEPGKGRGQRLPTSGRVKHTGVFAMGTSVAVRLRTGLLESPPRRVSC